LEKTRASGLAGGVQNKREIARKSGRTKLRASGLESVVDPSVLSKWEIGRESKRSCTAWENSEETRSAVLQLSLVTSAEVRWVMQKAEWVPFVVKTAREMSKA
jgi:hypothetical protein